MLGALNMVHTLVVDLDAADNIGAYDNMNKTPKDLAQERGHHQIAVKIDHLLRGEVDETSSNEDDSKLVDDGRFMEIEGYDKPSPNRLSPSPTHFNVAKNLKNSNFNEDDYERKSGESSSEEEEKTEKMEEFTGEEGSEREFKVRTAERQKKQLNWEAKRKKFQKTRDLELQRMIVKRQEIVFQEERVKNHKKN